MGVTSIRLQPDTERSLAELAAKLERSKNYIINQALKEYIARQSRDDAMWADTLEALSSIKRGASVPESEVHAWLQSWGSDEESIPPGK